MRPIHEPNRRVKIYTAHFSKRPEGFPEGSLIEVLVNPQDEVRPFVCGGKFHTESEFVLVMRTQERVVKKAAETNFMREHSKLELMREAFDYFKAACEDPLL